ncbi:large ribosomal subunit protein bL19m [Monosporozyma servazzii]
MLASKVWCRATGVSLAAKRLYQVPTSTKKIIPIYPPIQPSSLKPTSLLQKIGAIELDSQLDPTGWRRNILKKKKTNEGTTQGVESGDIVRVTYDQSKCSNDPFIGYVLSVDRKEVVQDASILLRNQITKTMVEMRVPIFSPLVEKIDILKKNDGKRRRNKHYYIRGTRLDVGNLEAKLRKRK